MTLSAEQRSEFVASLENLMDAPLHLLVDIRALERNLENPETDDVVYTHITHRMNQRCKDINTQSDTLTSMVVDMDMRDLTKAADSLKLLEDHLELLQAHIDVFVTTAPDNTHHRFGYTHGEMEQAKSSVRKVLKTCVVAQLSVVDEEHFFSVLWRVKASGMLDTTDESVFGQYIAGRGHYVFIKSIPDERVIGVKVTDHDWQTIQNDDSLLRGTLVAYAPDHFGLHTYYKPADLAKACRDNALSVKNDPEYGTSSVVQRKMDQNADKLMSFSDRIYAALRVQEEKDGSTGPSYSKKHTPH